MFYRRPAAQVCESSAPDNASPSERDGSGGDALLEEVQNVETLIELHQRKAALLRDVRARYLSGQLCVTRIRRMCGACRDA